VRSAQRFVLGYLGSITAAGFKHSGASGLVGHGFEAYGKEQMESALSEWYMDESNGCKNTATALASLEKAYTITPNARTSLALARLMVQLRRHEEAKELFMETFRHDPLSRDNWYHVGEFLLRHGQPEEIKDFYGKIRSIKPNDGLPDFIFESFDLFDHLVQDIGDGIIRNSTNGLSKRKLILGLVFFGRKHSDLFLDYCLPALLSEANLPAVGHDHDTHLVVITAEEDAAYLKSHWSYSAAREIVQVHLHYLPETMLRYAQRYWARYPFIGHIPITMLTNLSTRAAIECGRQLSGDVVSVCPDNIVTNCFLQTLSDLMRGDVSAVCGPGFRVYEQPVLDIIDSDHRNHDGTISISPREMSKLLMKHIPDPFFVDSRQFSLFPIYLCWRADDQGFLAHVNHYVPWLIRGEYLSGPLSPNLDPIDGFFVERNLLNKEKILLVDSPDICAFDVGLNPLVKEPLSDRERRLDVMEVADWIRPWLTPMHERYFRNGIKYRFGDNTDEWEQMEELARNTVDHIISISKAT